MYSNGVKEADARAPARSSEPSIGSGYRRVCVLASGGVGTVELALREEGRFRRLYAVKRLLDVYRDDADFRAMFLDEARIAGLIRHPNVVSVLDVGEDERGPYLVMDYVEGVSAAALVTRAVASEVQLPLQVCVRVAMEVAEGLHAAHEQRDARGRPMHLVHRDVSPQNLLIGFDGITRVTDFGIAKALGRSTRTQTGVLKGKFGYMSPEQLRFEEPDRRSDVFSLGIVLFELASGERLYKNVEGMDGTRRILNEPPPDLAEHRDDVPPDLVHLLFSMLAKDPEHRPADAKTVARRLEGILAELVVEEGRVEVDEFLATAFAEQRRQQEVRVQGALGAFTLEQPTGAFASDTERTVRDVLRRPFRAGLVLACAAAIAAAVAWWTTTADNPTADHPPASLPASPAPSPIGEGALGPGPSAASAGGEGPVGLDPSGAPGDGVTVEEERPARARPRRRRGPRRTEMESGAGVPMWDWQ